MELKGLRLVGFFAVQTVTSGRVLLAAGALLAAQFERVDLAATFITLGIVTDGVDGPIARGLDVESEFGGLFDYFADYLCYIVAPWSLSRVLVQGNEPLLVMVLALPLLTGAIRYSRNGTLLRKESFEQLGFPGLLTVFYALLVASLVFLRLGETIDLKWPFTLTVLCFSFLMISPIRYPKLTRFKSVFFVVYISLCLMPFVWTWFLASSTLILVFAYAVVSPWIVWAQNRPVQTAAVSKSLNEP